MKKEDNSSAVYPNMITFRGKFTCSPNTLNNEYHTYQFAYYWQNKHMDQVFTQELKRRSDTERDKTINSFEWRKKMVYSQANWMKLINSVAAFNRDYVQCYKKAVSPIPPINIMDFKAFRLFHDWDVWGDSTSFPELKATSVLNCDQNKAVLEPLKSGYHLSSKMGANKCIIANMDTDSQDMSKLFAFTLNMNEQLKLITSPSVCRVLHFRTVDTLPWTSSMGVDWFSSGKVKPVHSGIKDQNIKYPFDTIYKPQQKNTHSLFRMMQYRYNHPTKVSSVVGYIMNIDSNNPCPNKYWRIIQAKGTYKNPNPAKIYNSNLNEGTTIEVYIQNIYTDENKKGVLIDLSGALLDGNNQDYLPNYPSSFSVTISQTIKQVDSKRTNSFSKTFEGQAVKELFHNSAGIYIFPQNKLVLGVAISVQVNQTISSMFSKDPVIVKLNGIENQLQIQIQDKFVKTATDIYQTNLHNNYVQQKLYVTSYGIPIEQGYQLSLQSKFNIDSSGLTQYTSYQPYLDFINDGIISKVKQMDEIDGTKSDYEKYKVYPPKTRIRKLLQKEQSKDFKKKYGNTWDKINENVFQDKLDDICELTDNIIKRLFVPGQGLQYTFKDINERTPFGLCLSEEKRTQKCKVVSFTNGQATIRVYLNKDLTQNNNPRHPSMESLCVLGVFSIKNPKTGKIFKSTDFTGIFYENNIKFDQKNYPVLQDPYEGIDWLHVVGPKLKVMGLMYPSMQKIVDLYNYDGLSMDAMKRAFEIQDQNNSRYMPATREMSPITHRQIRRWLYNPVYDADVKVRIPPFRISKFLFGNKKLTGQNQKVNQIKEPISQPVQDLECLFIQKKKALLELTMDAFNLQLTTIPIYLSALYSLKDEGQTSKLIRSVAKDEMRHLFIVSNLINSLGGKPPYPPPQQSKLPQQKSKQKQPTKPQKSYIPHYPINISDMIVFNFLLPQNKFWSDLMKQIPIDSCNAQQLLRFIVIEVPSQIYDVRYQYHEDDDKKNVKKKDFFERMEELSKIIINAIESIGIKNKQRCERVKKLDRLIRAVGEQLKNNEKLAEKDKKFLTIGMAYEKIMNSLWELNDLQKLCLKKGIKVSLFSGDIRKQYTYIYLKNMTKIYDLRTALEQIRLITEEGQGSNLFSLTGQLNKTSHFIKFLQIYTGCDISIHSQYQKIQNPKNNSKNQGNQSDKYKRTAVFKLKPNHTRFPNFGSQTPYDWSNEQTNKKVWETVENQIKLQRFSDNMQKTTFPNTYAPISFLNAYEKILQELGFIFSSNPQDFIHNNSGNKPETQQENVDKSTILSQYDRLRMKAMQNAIAKMRQMTMHASHIVNPNDTYNTPKAPGASEPKIYESTPPKYNLDQSHYIEQ